MFALKNNERYNDEVFSFLMLFAIKYLINIVDFVTNFDEISPVLEKRMHLYLPIPNDVFCFFRNGIEPLLI